MRRSRTHTHCPFFSDAASEERDGVAASSQSPRVSARAKASHTRNCVTLTQHSCFARARSTRALLAARPTPTDTFASHRRRGHVHRCVSFAQPRTERQRARQRRARLRDDPKTKPFTPGNTPQRASAAQPLAQGMRRQACHTPHRWEQAASAAADAGTVAEVHTQQKVQRGASAHAREPGGPNKLHP